MSIKEMTKSKGPKLDWKVGLSKNTMLIAAAFAAIGGSYAYMQERYGFVNGAVVVLENKLDDVIH